MLFRNDIFLLDGKPYRLLETGGAPDSAWVISLDDVNAWPELIRDYQRLSVAPVKSSADLVVRNSTVAMLQRRDSALERITPLVARVPEIFDPTRRNAMVKGRANEIKCSERTIHKDLRRYWKGGQTADALLADYDHCGRSDGIVTAGRGAPPQADHEIYQLTNDDVAHMKKFIEKLYLKDNRESVTGVHQKMLEAHYAMRDGNGKKFILPLGAHPSIRQFRRFVRKQYSLETQLRGREGDKDFERDHRGKLGSVLDDCLGVGHFYEIDATIVDLYAVSTIDVQKIVGKPTLYIIVDRKSHLIVGFYLGFENASWSGAMETIRSISADKRELCARFGVEYNPEDWPAHEVFPKQFLADRGGEMKGIDSNQVCDGLHVGVTNLPGERPDWKPLVECGFKLIHSAIRDVAPGFDPPENAMRRRGKKYDKDACLNLRELGKIILEAIIAHNHRPTRHYELSVEELLAKVDPDPISIWNHNIVERAGLLTRFPEPRVRYALLPRDESAVTEEGIVFRGIHYTCPEAVSKGWFVQARKKRFKVDVSYDSRLVDHIHVHDRLTGTQPYLATLTTRSEKYRGLSFAEVKVFESMRKATLPAIIEKRAQGKMEFHDRIAPVINESKARLRDAGPRVARSSRRADTKDAREIERRGERQVIASLAPEPTATNSSPASGSNVVALSRAKTPVPNSLSPKIASVTPAPGISTESTVTQKLQAARLRMLNGY